MTTFDDPVELADVVASRPRPLLVGLDVDGVLAPLVDHAADSRLLDGVDVAVEAVAALPDVHVAVVSGRSLTGLDQFGFGASVTVIGSHGLEQRDVAMAPLDATERARLARLTELADDAADAAGPGAWVEHKPASVVVHVRQAGEHAPDVLAALRTLAEAVPGAWAKPGSNVLELLARRSDKGTAITSLRDQTAATTTVFIGDDVTDEDAFACLGAGDIAIKVGPAPTIAPHAIADPAAVLELLRRLAGRTA